MDGPALASRAVRTLARAAIEMTERHGLKITDLAALVAHGGNGRMPALLARTLGVPPETVWSLAPEAGNLGAASLPAAWALHRPAASGPIVWVAVGAGLQWGAGAERSRDLRNCGAEKTNPWIRVSSRRALDPKNADAYYEEMEKASG